jgi:Papain family cysteine protease
MPNNTASFNNSTRSFDVRPDRYDVRDRKYQPRLINLPPVFPEPALVKKLLPAYSKLILDQGSEGACTGFGLAAMINYLRFKDTFIDSTTGKAKKSKAAPIAKVSARMLYEHARLYDEWQGEDYSGSSCRGAMKGWHRHGVCLDSTWPYLQPGGKGKSDRPGKPKPHWATEAAAIPLGAYYRIEVDDITAMQSAICEVGAVLVSSKTHQGWGVGWDAKSLPTIQWTRGLKKHGNHAYALVGYNSSGFILQNSWSPRWGHNGFALLTYEDWLTHATDAWVASLGVPRPTTAAPRNYSSTSLQLLSSTTRTSTASLSPSATSPWSEEVARDHALILGNDGVLLRSSGAHDPAEFVSEVLMQQIKHWAAKSTNNRRIAIYAHGGLNDESDAIARTSIMGPYFEANGIFPIFIVWKTGWKESLVSMGQDILQKWKPGDTPASRTGGMLDWITDKFGEGWDYTVETALGFLGKSLWRQMKQNAQAAGHKNHGATILAKALIKLQTANTDLQIHLLGHSAGSIWQGQFLSTQRSIQDQLLPPLRRRLHRALCQRALRQRPHQRHPTRQPTLVSPAQRRRRTRRQRRRILPQVTPLLRLPRQRRSPQTPPTRHGSRLGQSPRRARHLQHQLRQRPQSLAQARPGPRRPPPHSHPSR